MATNLKEDKVMMGFSLSLIHISTWYTAGYRNSSKLRGRINEVETYEQLEALFQEVCGFMA